MSHSLDDLKSEVKAKALNWLAVCKERGYDVLITQTRRSIEEQDKLYAQGRTEPGKIVTNARGGESYHNYDCAIDFVPMRNGKPVWTYATTEDSKLWFAIGGIAEACGFEWSGRWAGKLKEMCHIQDAGGLTLAQLRSNKSAEPAKWEKI